ncbi:MAG: hypothetical protein ACFFF4_12345, partial [Candidatus Thorarchaeota archaeon]
MSGLDQPEQEERMIELDIVRAFASSIIEFEAVLFQKFMMFSASHSLVTEKMFRKILNQMHAKGYVSPVEFQGKRCWKRLIVEDDLEVSDLTPEEVRRVLREGQAIIPQYEERTAPRESVVSDTNVVAEEIRQTLLTKLYADRPITPETLKELQYHVNRMRKALNDGPDVFLKYVKRNIPSILEPMEHILKAKGETVLLL